MIRPVPWIGTVSEDGRRIYFDHDREFRAALAEFAGQEVEMTLGPRHRAPSAALRGYYFGALVDLVIHEDGHATAAEAHDAIVFGVLCPAWAKERPSTSGEAMSHDEMVEFVERACAHFIVDRGWVVPAPEPDPVRRYERKPR